MIGSVVDSVLHALNPKLLALASGVGVILTDVTNPIIAICGAILAVAGVVTLAVKCYRWLGEKAMSERVLRQRLDNLEAGQGRIMRRLGLDPDDDPDEA